MSGGAGQNDRKPYRIARWLLGGLGAVRTGAGAVGRIRLGPGGAELVEAAGPGWEDGVPGGTVTYAAGAALATAALASFRGGRPIVVHEADVAVQIFLPEVMAASYRSPTAMRPPPPVSCPGGGWVHADLGAPGDGDRFAHLLATLGAGPDAATVAAAAQEWRLAVCDYRPYVRAEARLPFRWSAGVPTGRPGPRRRPARDQPLGGVAVVDLTTMWAGPLATWLLQTLGAEVVKIEPDFRPDGFRALSGGGIRPEGRPVDPGRDSAMWVALNRHKETVPLDLRDAEDRASFSALAAAGSLVIDSFSPRVMPNFGLTPLPAGPTALAMPAFGPGPRRPWVAYGSGIHALSGLGDSCGHGFVPPIVSYPDPLSGFLAALMAVAAVVARDRDLPLATAEVPLEAATQPLTSRPLRVLAGSPVSPGPALLAAGRFEPVRVGRYELLHPQPPWEIG